MTREYLMSLGIDYDDAMNRFMGNSELFENFLKSFKDDTSYAQLIKALDAKNVDAAFNAAHSLKGLSGNLSMKDLYDHVCILVEELRVKDMSNIEHSLPPVTACYNKLIEGLK